MAFTDSERQLLFDVIDRAVYESQNEASGIELYLNHLRDSKTIQGREFTPESRKNAINCAQEHLKLANQELHDLIGLKNKVIGDIG